MALVHPAATKPVVRGASEVARLMNDSSLTVAARSVLIDGARKNCALHGSSLHIAAVVPGRLLRNKVGRLLGACPAERCRVSPKPSGTSAISRGRRGPIHGSLQPMVRTRRSPVSATAKLLAVLIGLAAPLSLESSAGLAAYPTVPDPGALAGVHADATGLPTAAELGGGIGYQHAGCTAVTDRAMAPGRGATNEAKGLQGGSEDFINAAGATAASGIDPGEALPREHLLCELYAIDQRAFEMARAVLEDPALRARLADEARRLLVRLREIHRELQLLDPDGHTRNAYLVSEAIMDLSYVAFDLPIVSLRIGQLMRLQERGGD
jgi:hypothetical protein